MVDGMPTLEDIGKMAQDSMEAADQRSLFAKAEFQRMSRTAPPAFLDIPLEPDLAEAWERINTIPQPMTAEQVLLLQILRILHRQSNAGNRNPSTTVA